MTATRREFLHASAGTTLALQTACTQKRRPNILFMQTDDQPFDYLGCAGNRFIQTPNIDKLAADGVRFDNAFTTTAICCSTRASVLTGQHMRRHGILDFATPLSADALEATYPVLLRNAGYRTAFLGKYAIGRTPLKGVVDSEGEAPGFRDPSLALPSDRFDYWFGFPQGIDFRQVVNDKKRHLTQLLAERAIDFFRSVPAGQPFCMSLNFKAPHGPIYFDPDLPNPYEEAEIPPPASYTKADFDSQPEFLRKSLNGNTDGRWPDDPRGEFLRRARTYYRLLTGVDIAVGKIMAALKELGLDDNTVIIYTSDHGSLRGAHGLTGKWIMYEESIRVPLIIRDPGLPANLRGSQREEMALNIDMAPTMLGLAGAPVPATMQGRDLGPLVSNEPVKWRDNWFYEHTFNTPPTRLPIARSEGVRTTTWKYIRYTDQEPPHEQLYEQLFDLANDPLERRNLAGEKAHEKTLGELRARWRELRAEAA